jgi:hypothetical protein
MTETNKIPLTVYDMPAPAGGDGPGAPLQRVPARQRRLT